MNKSIYVSKQDLDRQFGYIEKIKLHNDKFYNLTGERKTAYVRTYGCQQNVSDGEKIKGILKDAGYDIAGSPAEADVVIFNTCAIRENAEDRVFGNVGALKNAKRKNPGMIIGVCGCMTQQKHIAERFKARYPYVDIVFGTHALYKLPEFILRKLDGEKRIFDIENKDGEIAEDIPLLRDSSFRANLPVMYGCNNFCTYCIVPYVRGRERSRDPELIISEAQKLVDSGYKELTLLGQNVNSYSGSDMKFSELLKRLNDIPGDFVINFMTSHPKDCSKELIDTISRCDKVSKHLHLPVQSGSDRILKLMNRKYDTKRYYELIEYAKEQIPDVVLTSDIIVGFPGETEQDFLKTLELIERVRYHSLFTFIYSRREGTKAALMEDPVSKEEKGRWFKMLLDKQEKIGREIYESYRGKQLRALVADTAKQPGHLTARYNNIIVDVSGAPQLVGKFVDVEIKGAVNSALLGNII